MLVAIADFNTHMYDEIISSIDRDDESLLDEAIAAAEGQVKGYLSRFNISSLFSATGDARDKTLMMYIKDIACWQFIALANPNLDIELFQTRYEMAITELNKIQSGKVSPYGWPLQTTPEGSDSFFHTSSATRRETRW